MLDLDDILHKCRDARAQALLAEAVACYRAGAYRASIISCWNSLIVDYIQKLHELSSIGDKNATAKLDDLKKIREGGRESYAESEKFENTFLDVAAKDFELFSPIDLIDLYRLKEDRNRSAHPSMHDESTRFDPPPELARLHIVNTALIALSQEPVQGKAALERLKATIESELFPTDRERAKNRLHSPPLLRCRPSLMRNHVISLMKSIARDSLSPVEMAQRVAALGATIDLYRSTAEPFFVEEFKIHQSQMKDEVIGRLVCLMATNAGAWTLCTPPNQDRVRSFFDKATGNLLGLVISYGLQVPGLSEIISEKVSELDSSALTIAVQQSARPEFLPVAISQLKIVHGFRSAESLYEGAIQPYESIMSPTTLADLIDVVAENGQAWDAALFPDYMERLFKKNIMHLSVTSPAWLRLLNKTVDRTKYDGLREVARQHGLVCVQPTE
jgi:hypothetical protein